mmetsp:Transcript_96925/g.269651  ORF Transcript_96925/g.269651 Transcript_96925/m.269651 type:complete len:293 (-) Transcript_96925:245-1123(-)
MGRSGVPRIGHEVGSSLQHLHAFLRLRPALCQCDIGSALRLSRHSFLLADLHGGLLAAGLYNDVLRRDDGVAALGIKLLQVSGQTCKDARLQHITEPVDRTAAEERHGFPDILSTRLRDVILVLAQAVHLRPLFAAMLGQVVMARSWGTTSTAGTVDQRKCILVESTTHILEHVHDERIGATKRHATPGLCNILFNHQWPGKKVTEEVQRNSGPRGAHRQLLDDHFLAPIRVRPLHSFRASLAPEHRLLRGDLGCLLSTTQEFCHGAVQLVLPLGAVTAATTPCPCFGPCKA